MMTSRLKLAGGWFASAVIGAMTNSNSRGDANLKSKPWPVPAVVLLTLLVASTAGAQTSAVSDPQGDAFYTPGLVAPPALDILAASFTISGTISGTTLTFTVDVAGPFSALSALNGSQGAYIWSFGLDTNISTFPPGFPFDRTAPLPQEFIVWVTWDGVTFSGELIDRQPALAGGEMLHYPIPVSVSGSRITVIVPAALASYVQPLPGAHWWVGSVRSHTVLTGKGTHGVRVPDRADGDWP